MFVELLHMAVIGGYVAEKDPQAKVHKHTSGKFKWVMSAILTTCSCLGYLPVLFLNP